MATKDRATTRGYSIAQETSSRSAAVYAFREDTAPASRQDRNLAGLIENLAEAQGRASWAHKLAQCSHETGGYVQINPDYSFMPFLPGTDGRPVFLFQLIEAIDEFTDYDRLVEDYPLSYGQISGVFAFLRKVAAVNAAGVDVDEVEDQMDEIDGELIHALRAGLADQEPVRVLDLG